MNSLQFLFPTLVLIVLILKLYLNYRQANSVKVNYNRVPTYFTESINLTMHQRAGQYTLAKLRLNNIETIISSILVVLFTVGGIIQYVDNTINLSNYPITQGIILILIISLISMIFDLPLSFYSTFGIEQRFGFNHSTLWLFIIDGVKSMILFLAIGIPFLYLVFWLMSIMGSLWWLWVWGVFCAFNLLVMLVYPTFIAPLFNKFTPLENDVLRARINKLLIKCGFKSNGIFVMDGSRRSSHGNAYFTGIGKTKRIVFFDTLIRQLTNDEIEAILAHELGHFKKKHIIKQIGISFLITLGVLYVLSLLVNQPTFFNALGVNHITNYNALILFFMLLNIIMFPFAPISSFLSRKNEFEADDFAREYSNKDALISGLVKLYKENASTLTPDTIYAKFYYSHPPAMIRINNLEKKS